MPTVIEWRKCPEAYAAISPGGFTWRAYVGIRYIGSVYNDGASGVGGEIVWHGSIHLAALHVARAAKVNH